MNNKNKTTIMPRAVFAIIFFACALAFFAAVFPPARALAQTQYPTNPNEPLSENISIRFYLIYDNGALKQNNTYTVAPKSKVLLTSLEFSFPFQRASALNFGNDKTAQNTLGDRAYIAKLLDASGNTIEEISFDPQKGNREFKQGLVVVYVPYIAYLAKVEFYGPDGVLDISMNAPASIAGLCNKNGVCEKDKGETSNFCEADCPRPPKPSPTPAVNTATQTQEQNNNNGAEISWWEKIPKPYLYGGIAGVLFVAAIKGISVARKRRENTNEPNAWES